MNAVTYYDVQLIEDAHGTKTNIIGTFVITSLEITRLQTVADTDLFYDVLIRPVDSNEGWKSLVW